MRFYLISLCGLCVWMLVGCAATSIPPPGERLGALPYHGPMTLYEAVDPQQLGRYAYGEDQRMFWREEARGILYTCKAGFLDLAHICETIDYAMYYHARLVKTVDQGVFTVTLPSTTPCVVHITLDVPEAWLDEKGKASPALYESLEDVAMQLAWIMTTWYEIVTWFGYKSTGLVPEDLSAFTYDDTVSHAVGLLVVEKLFEIPTHVQDKKFNAHTREALLEVLQSMKPLTPDQTDEAVVAVEDLWWSGPESIKRYLHIGIETGQITPWLVRGLPYCENAQPIVFDVPPLQDALRPDGKPLVSIVIEPHVFEGQAIIEILGNDTDEIIPHRDFPPIMQRLREGFTERYDSSFERPYDD